MQRLHAAFAVLACAAAAAGQTTNIGANFETLRFGQTNGTVPPDTQGWGGQNHFTVLHNGGYRLFDKTGAQIGPSISDNAFWANAGLAANAGESIGGDNRILFDPHSGRWFAAAFSLTFTAPTGTNPNGLNNRLLVAVSNTNDPSAGWRGLAFASRTGVFADFPTLGVDARGIYIGTNDFTTGFAGRSLYSIPKADLLGAVPTLANMTRFDNATSNIGNAPTAVTNFNPNAVQTHVLGTASLSSTRHTAINNPQAAGATLGTSTAVATGGSQSPDATQPDATNNAATGYTLDTSDSRTGGTVSRVGDLAFAIRGTNSGGRSAQLWTVYNYAGATPTLLASWTIADPNLHLYHAAIAANGSGDLVIAGTRSGFVAAGDPNNRYPGTFAIVGRRVGNAWNFGPIIETQAGAATYRSFDDDEPIRRWGDYSQVNVDPTDPGIFWAAQQYANDAAATVNTNWSTNATEIILSNAGEVRWRNAANGNLGNGAAYYDGAAPTAGSHVIFSRNGAAHAATAGAGTTAVDRISVRQGNTTLSIGAGNTVTAANAGTNNMSLMVGEYAGTPTFTVSGGGTLNVQSASLSANRVDGVANTRYGTNNGARATMNVSGAGTAVNVAGALHVGGDQNGAGGIGTLNITAGGRMAVAGGGAVYGNGSTVNVTGAGSVLSLNGTFAGTGAINTSGGGRLEGNAVLSNAVTIAAGGTVAPGNSVGLQAHAGAFNMLAGEYEWELGALTTAGAGTNFDLFQVNAGGLATFGGTAAVRLDFDLLTAGLDPNGADGFWNADRQWLIVDDALNGAGVAGNFASIANAAWTRGFFTLSGGNGDIFLNFTAVTAVPEPGSLGLLAGAGAAFLLRRRRVA